MRGKGSGSERFTSYILNNSHTYLVEVYRTYLGKRTAETRTSKETGLVETEVHVSRGRRGRLYEGGRGSEEGSTFIGEEEHSRVTSNRT